MSPSRTFAILALAFCITAVAGDYGNGGWGDPMFRGMDGRIFYFDGVVGKIFNILSEQDHQLNAEFSLGPHKIDAVGKQTNGTYMTAFGLQMFSSKVEMHVDEEGQATVAVNGKQVDKELNETNDYSLTFVEPNGVKIVVEKYRPEYGYAVTARSHMMELVMFATIKQFDPVVNEIARGHLNFEMAINQEALHISELHGILGQATATRASDTALLPEELSTVFLGQGKPNDYIVSSLFGTDDKFNLFGSGKLVKAGSVQEPSLKSRSSLKLSASRRFLKEGSFAPLAKITGLL